MSKVIDKKNRVLGKFAAIQTLLERYPTLTTTDPLLTNVSLNTSVGFLMDALSVLGVSYTDLVQWVARLLSTGNTKVTDGILTVIEHAIKAAIFANIKDVFTCNINPLLPDCLMKYSNPEFPDGTRPDPCDLPEIIALDNYRKIEIDLNQIDMFGILSNCPTDIYGSSFYFDSYDSIYDKTLNDPGRLSKGSFNTLEELEKNFTDINKPIKGDVYKTTKGINKYYQYDGEKWVRYVGDAAYTQNTIWKSCDFNAFLWYVINKGTLSNLTDIQHCTWDNRVQHIKTFANNQSLRNEFFKSENCTGTTKATQSQIEIKSSDKSVSKKQIILCEFEERPTPVTTESNVMDMPSSNILRVWLNANRYYRTNVLKSKKDPTQAKLELNKTVFEFNYDYIYSLKLFDTKTIITQIMNSLLGFSASVSASLTVEQKMMLGQVSQIVRKVMQSDDTTSNDCYFKFSNDEYDTILQKATTNNNVNAITQENADAVLDAILNIRQNATQVDEISTITRTIEDISTTLASNSSFKDEFKFSWGFNFIYDFINQLVESIVLQVITPKVAILYLINGAIMGNKAGDISSWKDFLNQWPNLLFNIIKTIKDLLLEELYKFVIEQLKPLLELLISKLALETIQYYRDLIEQLLLDCIPTWNLPNLNMNTVIDNVNYADIVPIQTEPQTDNC